eukprot:12314115-Alexandrium_andersonii.AAC.1
MPTPVVGSISSGDADGHPCGWVRDLWGRSSALSRKATSVHARAPPPPFGVSVGRLMQSVLASGASGRAHA